MNYEDLMCKFCKECIGIKLNKYIIESKDIRNGNTIVTRCDNFYPKYNFEGEK